MKLWLVASALLLGGAGLTGCASTGNIAPQYVSPAQYQPYDCQTLVNEYNRVERYIDGARRERSTLAASGVGVGISAGRWGISPNISLGVGQSNNTRARDAKLARLYGERDALIQSARAKGCNFASNLKLYGE